MTATAHDHARSLLDEIRDICAAHGVKTRAMDKLEVLTSAYMAMDDSRFNWAPFKLTKMERRIADLLYRHLGKDVHYELLADAMYFDNDDGSAHITDLYKILQINIWKIRKRLQGSPFTIENQRDVGYRMTRKA